MQFPNLAKMVKTVTLLALAALLLIGTAAAQELAIRLDSANKHNLPKDFRIIAELSASGSAQFSEAGLKKVRESLPEGPLVIVDLRQESHGFVNGSAVSWYGDRNWANLGKGLAEVKADEENRLGQLQAGQVILLDKDLKKDPATGELTSSKGTSVLVKTVASEEQLANSLHIGYFRLPVTDHRRPLDADVDSFIAFIRTLPPGVWLHFHCEAGHGRTTTFLVMLDMMKNAKTDSFETILERQHSAGGIDLLAESERGWRVPFDEERVAFLRNFYEYCRINKDGFATSWTSWLAGR